MLTVKYVEEMLDRIKGSADDPEIAHSFEDDLAWNVLFSIAANPLGAQELAKAAIKSQDIEFPRWCA